MPHPSSHLLHKQSGIGPLLLGEINAVIILSSFLQLQWRGSIVLMMFIVMRYHLPGILGQLRGVSPQRGEIQSGVLQHFDNKAVSLISVSKYLGKASLQQILLQDLLTQYSKVCQLTDGLGQSPVKLGDGLFGLHDLGPDLLAVETNGRAWS